MSTVKNKLAHNTLGHITTEIRNLFTGASSKEILDILHLLRVEYAKELFDISRENSSKYEDMLGSMPNSAGVYILLMVDPKDDVMLYIGRTSGKSKTSGLRFRLRDHTRILGKTPLTLFIPGWWIKKAYSIVLEDKEKSKALEKRLWMFLDQHVKKRSQFDSIEDLEKEMTKAISNQIQPSDKIHSVEFQPHRNPSSPFLLKGTPAGHPRNLNL